MSADKWSGKSWTITVTDNEMALAQASGSVTIPSANAARLEVRRRWFRWRLYDKGQPRPAADQSRPPPKETSLTAPARFRAAHRPCHWLSPPLQRMGGFYNLIGRTWYERKTIEWSTVAYKGSPVKHQTAGSCQPLRPSGHQASVTQGEEQMKRTMIAPLAISAAAAISLAVAGPALAGRPQRRH
jgi:hypothetical protein